MNRVKIVSKDYKGEISKLNLLDRNNFERELIKAIARISTSIEDNIDLLSEIKEIRIKDDEGYLIDNTLIIFEDIKPSLLSIRG